MADQITHKFAQGDIVQTKSGAQYKVRRACTMKGEPAYEVDGWRNGQRYGASRDLRESALTKASA